MQLDGKQNSKSGDSGENDGATRSPRRVPAMVRHESIGRVGDRKATRRPGREHSGKDRQDRSADARRRRTPQVPLSGSHRPRRQGEEKPRRHGKGEEKTKGDTARAKRSRRVTTAGRREAEGREAKGEKDRPGPVRPPGRPPPRYRGDPGGPDPTTLTRYGARTARGAAGARCRERSRDAVTVRSRARTSGHEMARTPRLPSHRRLASRASTPWVVALLVSRARGRRR